MRRIGLVIGTLTLGLSLSACATGGRVAPTQVTRFHLNQPIQPGSVRVSAGEHSELSLERETYIAAVERQLARLGFTPVRGVAAADYGAVIDLRTMLRPGGRAASPVSIGIGGGTFGGGRGGGLGVGGGVGFPIGGGRRGDIAIADMSVRLMRRAGEEVVWEGRVRAETRAGAPAAQPVEQADRLATALFAGFPGESGRTVTVP